MHCRLLFNLEYHSLPGAIAMYIEGRDHDVMEARAKIGRNAAGPDMERFFHEITAVNGLWWCSRERNGLPEHFKTHGIPEYVGLKPLSIRITDGRVLLRLDYPFSVKSATDD